MIILVCYVMLVYYVCYYHTNSNIGFFFSTPHAVIQISYACWTWIISNFNLIKYRKKVQHRIQLKAYCLQSICRMKETIFLHNLIRDEYHSEFLNYSICCSISHRFFAFIFFVAFLKCLGNFHGEFEKNL